MRRAASTEFMRLAGEDVVRGRGAGIGRRAVPTGAGQRGP